MSLYKSMCKHVPAQLQTQSSWDCCPADFTGKRIAQPRTGGGISRGCTAHAGVDVNTDGWQNVIEMIMEQAEAMTALSQY